MNEDTVNPTDTTSTTSRVKNMLRNRKVQVTAALAITAVAAGLVIRSRMPLPNPIDVAVDAVNSIPEVVESAVKAAK